MADFVPGWSPDSALRARHRVRATTGFATVNADAAYPPAWAIPAFRILEQGQAGTCWDHAGTAVAEDFAAAHGLDIFPTCRRLTGWVGKQLEGGGNPTDGGNVTDALLAMTAEKGAGLAHEALWPYSDARRDLGTKPPPAVFADAKPFRLTQPVDVRDDDDARRLISRDFPVGNGIWWPFQWDRQGATFVDWIGPGTYGHALEECGYAMPGVFDDHAWFRLRNWHGQLYKPLPPEQAAKVPNYRPDRPDSTSDFWVRADVYAKVRGYGHAERVTLTDMTGFGHLFTLDTAFSIAGGFLA
jgi:hypothetical protein